MGKSSRDWSGQGNHSCSRGDAPYGIAVPHQRGVVSDSSFCLVLDPVASLVVNLVESLAGSLDVYLNVGFAENRHLVSLSADLGRRYAGVLFLPSFLDEVCLGLRFAIAFQRV